MRRRLLPAALLLPLALLLTACGGNSSAGTDTDGTGSVTLDVGDQKGGSEAILRAAGELENLHYKIKWSTFTSGPPLLEAVNARAVDIGGVGNTPPVFAAGAGSKITVVAAWHGTSRGDTILVPKGSALTRPQQLKGRSVAVAQGFLRALPADRLAPGGRAEPVRRQGHVPPAGRRARRVHLRQGRRVGGLGPVHLADPPGRAGPRCSPPATASPTASPSRSPRPPH